MMKASVPVWLLLAIGGAFFVLRGFWTDAQDPAVYDKIIVDRMGWRDLTQIPATILIIGTDNVPASAQSALKATYARTRVQLVFVPNNQLVATRNTYRGNVHIFRFEKPNYDNGWAGMTVTHAKPNQNLSGQGALDLLQAGDYRLVYRDNDWKAEPINY